MSDPGRRRVVLVPPNGWVMLAKGMRGDLMVGLLFNPLSWTVGVDFWITGGAISLGPFAFVAGLYPDDETEAAA